MSPSSPSRISEGFVNDRIDPAEGASESVGVHDDMRDAAL